MAQKTAVGNRYGRIPFVRGLPIAPMGHISVSVISVLPGTIMPTNVTLPKRVTISQVPGAAGGIAPESNYEAIEVSYRGTILADTPEEFRAMVDEMLNWLAGEITLEVLPGRFCDAHVSQHTLDPKWPGTNDVFVEFSFQASVPSGYFYDSLGNTYRTP